MMPPIEPERLHLTANFTLSEFLHGEPQVPEAWILDNLYRLANRLQVIRDLLGRPVIINSGYRSVSHNRRVGGAPKSMHLAGMAADIVVPAMPAAEVQQFLLNWSGGLGCYDHYTHVDIRPNRARWGGNARV